MSAAMDREVRVAGIGVHIPPSRQPNLPLLPGFGVDEEFMQRRIGVTTRAIKAPDQKTSDLCIQAFNDLARKVPGLDTDAIEMICLVTQNPDSRIPHTSAVIHQSLNLPASCMTFDISQGCAGFPHALAVATSLAERFAFDNALIFTCDPYSTIVDPSDRDTALLFGDAATVTFLDRAGPGFRLVDAAFGTRPGSAAVLRYEGRLVMEGREVFLNAARRYLGRSAAYWNATTCAKVTLICFSCTLAPSICSTYCVATSASVRTDCLLRQENTGTQYPPRSR